MQTNTFISKNTKITLLPKIKQRRIWEIDFLRGFCIILMIFDHLALLLGEFFGPQWFGYSMLGDGFLQEVCRLCEFYYNDSMLRQIGHPIVLFIFFAISGISCNFSRSNTKRGLTLAVFAVIYSLGSYAVQEFLSMSGVLVIFGVLAFYAACILLYAFISFITKNNKSAKVLASAAIVVVVVCLYHLYTPPETTPRFFAIFFPPYDIHGNPALFYNQASFSPGDLFPLIPYSAFFFFGTFIAPFLYGTKRSLCPILDRAWQKPVSFVGRYAIVFFIGHIILLYGLLTLISGLFITPGKWGF